MRGPKPNPFRVSLDLPAVRQKKGLSLHEIAAATKIGVNYLRAIEEGDFSKLPGGIYNVSYIRQYARAIEYNESELLAHYHQATGEGGAAEPESSSKGTFSSLSRMARVFTL